MSNNNEINIDDINRVSDCVYRLAFILVALITIQCVLIHNHMSKDLEQIKLAIQQYSQVEK